MADGKMNCTYCGYEVVFHGQPDLRALAAFNTTMHPVCLTPQADNARLRAMVDGLGANVGRLAKIEDAAARLIAAVAPYGTVQEAFDRDDGTADQAWQALCALDAEAKGV